MPPHRLRRVTSATPAPDRGPQCDLLRWALLGPRGAVTFAADRYPAGSSLAAFVRDFPGVFAAGPDGSAWQGLYVDYHSPRPHYDDHEPQADCDVLEGACFTDGSAMQAHLLLHEWAAADWDEGVIWSELERHYELHFHSGAEALRDALDRLAADPAAVDAAAALLRPGAAP